MQIAARTDKAREQEHSQSRTPLTAAIDGVVDFGATTRKLSGIVRILYVVTPVQINNMPWGVAPDVNFSRSVLSPEKIIENSS